MAHCERHDHFFLWKPYYSIDMRIGRRLARLLGKIKSQEVKEKGK